MQQREVTPMRSVFGNPNSSARVNKQSVKGFYYFATEYQRQKQQKRNPVHRIISGIAEPFVVHQRALRLRFAAARNGAGFFKSSAVLDDQFVTQTMDSWTGRGVQQETRDRFRVKSQAHKVVEDARLTHEQRLAIRDGIINTSNPPQNTGLSPDRLQRLQSLVQDNPTIFSHPQPFGQTVADEIVFGGLTPQEQVQAKELSHAVWSNTIMTGFNYVKSLAVISMLSSNPVGWVTTAGITLVSAGISGVTRGTRLWKEGQNHYISASRGMNVAQKVTRLQRILGVDWDEDPANVKAQLLRAGIAGGLVALGAKILSPFAMDGMHATATTVTENFQPPSAPHISLPNINVPTIHPPTISTNPSIDPPVAIPQPPQLVDTPPSIEDIHSASAMQTVTEHFLPDHEGNWQQLHTFAQSDGQGHNEIKLSYNGIDDGVAHNQHVIDIMLNGSKVGAGVQHVFIQNDAILAVNGPDANKLITLYDSSGKVIGQIHSSNLAQELGLTQAKIDHFTTLSQAAKGGLWHGTQDASDLQTILPSRGLYDNQSFGNYLWGYRLGGGYFKDGQFYIGASNHDFSSNVLQSGFHPQVFSMSPTIPSVPSPTNETYHSVLAPGLSDIDSWEDSFGNIFGVNPLTQVVDDVTDFQLQNVDTYLGWWDEPLLGALGTSAFVALGYAFGVTPPRRSKKVAGTLLTLVNPAWGLTMGVGYVAARLIHGEPLVGPVVPVPAPVPPPVVPTPIPTPQPEQPVVPEQSVPIVTDDINLPALRQEVGQSDTLKNTAPFSILASTNPQSGQNFLQRLSNTSAQEILDKLLAPIAEKIGISQTELMNRINTFLSTAGKLEKIGTWILVASKLYGLVSNPQTLEGVRTTMTNVVNKVSGVADATGENILAATKAGLQESGVVGEDLLALGEEALPVIEEAAPILAV